MMAALAVATDGGLRRLLCPPSPYETGKSWEEVTQPLTQHFWGKIRAIESCGKTLA